MGGFSHLHGDTPRVPKYIKTYVVLKRKCCWETFNIWLLTENLSTRQFGSVD